MFRLFTYIILLHSIILSDVNRQVLKSDSKELIIEYNINAETESDLYPISLLMGLPTQDFPEVSISFENPSFIPFDSQQEIKNGYEWTNKQRLQGLIARNMKVLRLINIKEEPEFYNKMTKTGIRLRYEMKLALQKIINSEEDIIRTGCPNLLLQ